MIYKKLKILVNDQPEIPANGKFVDTPPLLEKAWAEESGFVDRQK